MGGLALCWIQQLDARRAQHLGDTESQQMLDSRTGVSEDSVGVDLPDPVRRRFDQRPKPVFALAQRVFRSLPVGDFPLQTKIRIPQFGVR
jgi:hypothetical protein